MCKKNCVFPKSKEMRSGAGQWRRKVTHPPFLLEKVTYPPPLPSNKKVASTPLIFPAPLT